MNEQNLFRIGACYRQKDGRVVLLVESLRDAGEDGRPLAHAVDGEVGAFGQGHRFLDTGAEWDQEMLSFNRDLIPGELHQVDGEWVPIAAPRSDYFAEALKDETEAMWDALNAPMIARDGPATPPKASPIAAATPPTAHPAIPGLSRMSGGDWRLGAGLVGC